MKRVTSENWREFLWRGKRKQAQAAWEEGLKQRYEEITGQRVEGTGSELKTEAARGMMRFLIKRHAADEKRPFKKDLVSKIAHDLGLGTERVRFATRPEGKTRNKFTFIDYHILREEFFEITGRRLEAPRDQSLHEAVRGVLPVVVKKHEASGQHPNKKTISREIASMLGMSQGTAVKYLNNEQLPWLTGTRLQTAENERICEAFKKITGSSLPENVVVKRAAVTGLATHLSQHPHDQIGMPREALATTIHRLLGIKRGIVYRYLRETRQAKQPQQTHSQKNA